jgi:methyl-accepting chemotaxis protein
MKFFVLGFNQKLLLAVAFTLLGFSLLSFLSINSLSHLVSASTEVDKLNNKQAYLYQLKLELSDQVSRLNRTDIDVASALDEFYQSYESIISSGGEAGLTDDSLQRLLLDWVAARKGWLVATQLLGYDSNSGLRGEMKISMADLGNGLFAKMKERFLEVRAALDILIDNRDQASLITVKDKLENFNQFIIEQGFEEFIGPKVKAVSTPLDSFGTQTIAANKYEMAAVVSREKLIDIINTRSQSQNVMLTEARSSASHAGSLAIRTIVISSIIIAALVLGLLLLAFRQASKTLDLAIVSLAKISDGDLGQRLTVNENRMDQFDQVGIAVNHLTQTLSEMLSQLVTGSAKLERMSTVLTGTINQMVTDNDKTNEHTELTANSVDAICSTVNNMALMTEESHRQSSEASEIVQSGGGVINNALGTMNILAQVFENLNVRATELRNSSSKVDDVTDMINKLASQTNLLALNAAIEAARAGEAGRGFSVVADEVRSLAEKTVGATSEIDVIVGEMQQQMQALMTEMNNGAKKVLESREEGASALEVVDQIKILVNLATERSSELSLSIDEIAVTSRSVSSNMVDVKDSTKKGNQLAHEVLELVSHLTQLASEQKDMTKQFHSD